MYVKNQIFFVMGVSKSGFAVAKHILLNGGKCFIYEQLKSQRITKSIDELVSMGAINLKDEDVDATLSISDVLVISPGVPINHEVAVKAKKLGKRIIGELEYAYLQFTPPIVAVTGTNGKTTTVTIIDEIFKRQGLESHLVGNVGIPMSEKLGDVGKNGVMVAEVSSFQLESTNAFCPHVSCITNIAPDHLERHYSMENYVFLKKKIFKNQKESEYCVLNFDDSAVRGFYSEIKAKVVWVSLIEEVEGAYRKDGKLYYYGQMIIEEEKLKIRGEHNVYDVLFAIACACIMGVEADVISQVLQEFKGVKHRIEHICEKNGVTYYNDSKATNTASTISAIESMVKPTVLILGGSEKGEKYEQLFEKIKASPIRHVVLTGASRYKMLDCAGRVGYANLTVTANFNHAVKIAGMVAEQGDCVLLSPACASFDSFDGYEERGNAFKAVVEEM